MILLVDWTFVPACSELFFFLIFRVHSLGDWNYYTWHRRQQPPKLIDKIFEMLFLLDELLDVVWFVYA